MWSREKTLVTMGPAGAKKTTLLGCELLNLSWRGFARYKSERSDVKEILYGGIGLLTM
jgi:hypothetical protein